MRVGVWGAGNLGPGLAYRLVTTPFVSELHWTNQTYNNIVPKVIDIEHGLAFSPTCHTVRGYPQESVAEMLPNLDLLILTLGRRVKLGMTRADVYGLNAAVYRETVIPVLRGGFTGIVLVITNPVDLMARLVYREAGIDHRRVLGLGTVVETARLQGSLGSYLSPKRPARDVWAYAVGTHDQDFIPVAMPGLAVGDNTDAEELSELLAAARGEVARGADRVKTESGSSLHPVVEGAVRVAEAVALDRRSILTVSVLDGTTKENLFYSLPCCIGSSGLLTRHEDLLSRDPVHRAMELCCENMRTILRTAGEI